MKKITFENSSYTFVLSLEKVAENRAKYYAGRDYEKWTKDYNDVYKEEMDYIIDDEYEGIDWLLNNTDPDDFKWFIQSARKESDNKISNNWNDFEWFDIK